LPRTTALAKRDAADPVAAIDGSVAQAIAIVTSPSAPLTDRAPLYALLYRLQLEINRALRGPQVELALAMQTAQLDRIGPVQIDYRASKVEYLCNAPGAWDDADIQNALAGLAADPETADYVRLIPRHYEIDPKALAGAMHEGVTAARQLYREINRGGWRVERHGKPGLKVDEIKPKEAKP
jgi:hypothetical protein